MSNNISDTLLRGLSTRVTTVTIEKASVDAVNGVAKVLFSTNIPARKADAVVANTAVMEKAFDEVLKGKAHLVASSIHESGAPGLYVAHVKLNEQRVELAEAEKADSGYSMVVANVFSDAHDNIWNVTEDASGAKILVRSTGEDLSELFSQKPSAAFATASASVDLGGAMEFASVVSFLNPITEKLSIGFAVDTANVFDPESKTVVKVNPTLLVAGSDRIPDLAHNLNNLMGDKNATISELAAADVKSVYDYLEALYSQNPAFLSAYKDAVRRLFPTN